MNIAIYTFLSEGNALLEVTEAVENDKRYMRLTGIVDVDFPLLPKEKALSSIRALLCLGGRKNYISAIKMYRSNFGTDLKESKDRIDEIKASIKPYELAQSVAGDCGKYILSGCE
jgi:ribosomal protein L7/L12